jgi:glycosyltransferase involved in cell wall biosynthesis
MTQGIFIVVTAHNEAASLAATLGALGEAFPGAYICVADDGSSDATAQIARAAGAAVVSSGRVIGKGGAATLAARKVLERMAFLGEVTPTPAGAAEAGEGAGVAGGESEQPGGSDQAVILLCDGDLGASAARLGSLVGAVCAGEADVAVAAFARRVGGGVGLAVGFARWAIHRRCGLELHASISGQRALHAQALRDVLPFAPRFGMEMGMTIDAARAGYRVLEIELDLEHRATGRTLAGFIHRGRQLLDFLRVYRARG